MNFSNRSIVAAVAATALAAVGCSGSSTEPDRGVTLTVTVSRSAIRAGDSTTVTVTLTNTGSVLVSGPACPVRFEVLKNGTSLTPDMSDVCPAVSGSTALRPGEAHTTNYAWYGNDPRSAALLGPGAYTVQGRAYVDGALVRSAQVPVNLL